MIVSLLHQYDVSLLHLLRCCTAQKPQSLNRQNTPRTQPDFFPVCRRPLVNTNRNSLWNSILIKFMNTTVPNSNRIRSAGSGRKISSLWKPAAALFTAFVLALTPQAALFAASPLLSTTAAPQTAVASAASFPASGALTPESLGQIAALRGLPARYAGKACSILGDSISTYAGTAPKGYLTYYPNKESGISSMDQMWWHYILVSCGMSLLRSCSWSGSRMSGDKEDPAGKTGCSTKRISDLSGKDKTPDVILIMMGTNDFLSAVSLPRFKDCYGTCLDRIAARYPDASVICFTCFPVNCWASGTGQLNADGRTIDDYNEIIRQCGAARGLPVVETSGCGITVQNFKTLTVDGIHPNAQGALLAAADILQNMP